jgi:hypothetical protein
MPFTHFIVFIVLHGLMTHFGPPRSTQLRPHGRDPFALLSPRCCTRRMAHAVAYSVLRSRGARVTSRGCMWEVENGMVSWRKRSVSSVTMCSTTEIGDNNRCYLLSNSAAEILCPKYELLFPIPIIPTQPQSFSCAMGVNTEWATDASSFEPRVSESILSSTPEIVSQSLIRVRG